ncbi:hypothetical protein EVAR_91294_1 [Eumeta japonica]|uniref:Uncharacterized protein n=1 Tax=Eumeta variegata TaxID=151549 RepID=A0A4C2A3J1_EUMVA|nr:hypothetical protein EVAR_91294_1 [Eumeta japonica]
MAFIRINSQMPRKATLSDGPVAVSKESTAATYIVLTPQRLADPGTYNNEFSTAPEPLRHSLYSRCCTLLAGLIYSAKKTLLTRWTAYSSRLSFAILHPVAQDPLQSN